MSRIKLYEENIRATLKNIGRERFIEETIKTFKSQFTKEYEKHVERVKDHRENIKNKYASTDSKELRLLGFIPENLFAFLNFYLTEQGEPFMKSKREREFVFNSFPEFKSGEVI